MCGILFCYQNNKEFFSDAKLSNALALLQHRGPDQRGSWSNSRWYMGSTRLAITGGLQSTQPFVTEDGRYVCVFNGEIYNFNKLRKELQEKGWLFYTESETEVIVVSFLNWGTECFAKFDGQYALTILDSFSNKLFIARDRFGEKPLYYKFYKNGIIFASEISPIVSLHGEPAVLDDVSILQFLTNWYVQEPRTIAKDVLAFPPNSFCEIDAARISFKASLDFYPIHNRPITSSTSTRTEIPSIDEFERVLFDSINSIYPSHEIPALMLSGGIDSTLIACLLAEHGLQFKAFSTTLHESSHDESATVKKIARKLGIGVEFIEIGAPQLDTLLDSQSVLDIPIGEASYLAAWQSANVISGFNHKVVILGDGGDEILAGYPTYLATLISSTIPNFLRPAMKSVGNFMADLPLKFDHNSGLDRLIRFLAFQDNNPLLSHALWRANINPYDWHDILDNQRKLSSIELMRDLIARTNIDSSRVDLLFAAMDYDRYTWLSSSNLPKNDRAFMAHGVENRTPYLSNALVEFCDTAPKSLKIQKGQMKYLSKRLLEKKLGNESFIWQKKGWTFPIDEWLSRLEPSLEPILKDSHLAKMSPSLISLFNGKQRGIQASQRLRWGMIVLESWIRTRKYPIKFS